MIPAQHSHWFQSIFHLYLNFIVKRSFKKIEIKGTVQDKGMPILVIANHMSWWDGFWVLRLNKKVFKRKFHVMMLEEQLRNNQFLSKLGAFSIRKRSKSVIESLQYASNILTNNNNLLLLFPQGVIQSQHQRPFLFEQGWGRIFENLKNPVQVIMIAHLVDYFSSPKPRVNQYINCLTEATEYTCKNLQDEYNAFFEDCVNQQQET